MYALEISENAPGTVLYKVSDDIMNRKVDIKVPLVRRLVSTQFPHWADLPLQPVQFDGWDNRTFRLGENMAVRLPSAEAYALQVEKEQRWLPRLRPLLPLPIPIPLALGVPAEGYPWHWSIYQWLDGDIATVSHIEDLDRFAITLAEFLVALQRIDATDGPPPGQQNFWRGGPLTVYDGETQRALAALDGELDTRVAAAVWETALHAAWHGQPVWIHGDVAAGNLLVKRGRLAAVIDFGSSGVGDPACDLTIAWTLLSKKSREAFRSVLPLDAATWARGRGWALWKALITVNEYKNTDPIKTDQARHVIEEVFADYRSTACLF